MTKRIITSWAAITLFGMIAGVASGDDAAGVVRITDSPPVVPATVFQPGPAPATVPPATAGPVTPAPVGPANGVVAGAAVDGTCDDGCHDCHGHGHCCYWSWLQQGFGVPVATGLTKEAVVYYHYWPQKWYGEPGWALHPTFPMVYMPTDTTQLGFYYQRVPQWLPNPAMYPGVPRPNEWNRRDYSLTGGGRNRCPATASADAIPMLPTGAAPVGPGPVGPQPVPSNVAPPVTTPTVPPTAPSASATPPVPTQALMRMPPAPPEVNSEVPANGKAQTTSASTAAGN
jgi:hypothetical protein